MLTDKDRLLLDAIVTDDKNTDLAYILHRGKKPDATDFNIHRMSLRWLRSTEVADYLTKRKRGNIGTGNDTKENRSKKDIINELNAAIDTESDNKKRADMLLRLSDLLRESPSEDKPESHNNFYLPLSCQICELFKHFNDAQKIRDPERRKSIDETWYADYVDKIWEKVHGAK